MDERWSRFEGRSYLNLETFRRDGRGVQTPVWFVREGEALYVRTLAESGKVKRIRANAAVRVAPCDVNGRLLDDWLPAEACEMNDPVLAAQVAGWLEKKYGVTQVRAFGAVSSLRGRTYVILRVEASPR